MDEKAQLKEYKGYTIRANQVPEEQSAFGVRFGWAFKVYPSASSKPLCIVVLKSLSGERTQVNLEQALRLGENVVRSLIDEAKFDKSYYCYQWEPNGPESLPVTEVDCDEISPGSLRSPVL
mgnify:CR=1 FL=1